MNKVLTKKDITKELEILRHQKTVFISGTPLGTLYTEFTQTWDTVSYTHLTLPTTPYV